MDSIKKKERNMFFFTICQLLIITCLFSKLLNSHVTIFYNPFTFLYIVYEPTTIFYIISFLVPLVVKYYNRKCHVSNLLFLLSLSFSSLFFYINFPTRTFLILKDTKDTAFIFKKLQINLNFCLSLIISFITACLQYFHSKTIPLEFTEIEGIIKYFAVNTKKMLNRVLNMWFINLICGILFLIAFFLCKRFFIDFILIFIRCELVYNGKVINHLILLYISVMIYTFMTEFFYRLLIFNLSFKNKELVNFTKDKDIYNLRYVFYNITNLSYKYKYILNNICRNKPDLCSLLEYVEKECAIVKNVCNKIVEQHNILDNKLFMTIPQVNVNGSLLVKKYENHSYIDKIIYKLIYQYKTYLLIIDFNKNIKYMEDINTFINYLLKFRDFYVLLGDLDKRYTFIYKDLIECIRKVEEVCKIDLKIQI